MYVVAVYDIEVKRGAKALKLFRRYLSWVQNSVFEGELTKAQYAALKEEALGLMEEGDSVILYNLRVQQYMDRETLGVEPGTPGRFL
jgi:CRISPR-associated protein Cas2